jgi:2-(3-amino-3-carboxypropyl)histidine synthase
MNYAIANLEKDYELELDRIVSEIGKLGAKEVLLQLPDGLKPWGLAICDYLEKETGAKISIWLGACFGACDLPDAKADLVIQFGHAPWN